jgi:carboxyl-terminal processing protease
MVDGVSIMPVVFSKRFVSRWYLAAAALALGLACGGVAARAEASGAASLRRTAPADFSDLGEVEAFRRMHEKIAAEYAFTEWKGVDWPGLRARILPLIEAAAAAHDAVAYRAALQAYVAGLDDGHVNLPRNDAVAPAIDALTAAASGGTFGIGLVELDDGRVIAAAVAPGGPAARAGMRPGDVVARWGDRPIGEAIGAVDLGRLAAAARVATDAHRRLEQARLMTRAAIGTAVEIDLAGAEGASGRRVRLVAESDGPAALRDLAPRLDPGEVPITSRRIGRFGYIRFTVLADLADLGAWPEAIWTAHRRALAGFRAEGVDGLVLDLRGNHGGWDLLAMRICGTLRRTPVFYEATVFYDADTGRFRRFTVDDRTGAVVDGLTVRPEKPVFAGPVVALVDPMTISSGEGLARCVRERPGGATLGFHGTRGSFGLAGGEIRLPGGNVLHYPDGRAVDRDGTVLIDSRHGVGGVAPTVRVPVTFETAMAKARGEDVELAAALAYLDRASAGRAKARTGSQRPR